ncbi:MAG: OmpH family outer membrane protein [Pigmentiphaga sp.]|nr:OmpH family outer membrane protein [Pigmentiphaga sp.]
MNFTSYPSVSSVTPARALRRLAGGVVVALAAAGSLGIAAPAMAQSDGGTKVGFVSVERIIRDSAPAKAAVARIDAEFKKREAELQDLANRLRSQSEQYDRDIAVMSESDRIRRQRELSTLDSDFQRKRIEFQEDLNRRRNEEMSKVFEQADLVIKQIAESQNYDLVLQEAITVSPRVDITDQVIKALDARR